ncbi:FGGY-family carbohydrate kinase [Tropicimonas marinistellae]|uniref:FGGY-family carbohydrate kinase n=1 Tax=Tropicimonas marinistellae TaxID=1739787 RepID=UPI00082D8BD8|nr:FGGY-family carbohydrate kinase [Tropicimonas marinistellae]
MSQPRHIAVVDIGKTNAKVALVDLGRRAEIAETRTPNDVRCVPPYPHYDTDGLWAFILASLKDLHAQHRVDALTVTTHGASAALLDAEGNLATPVLDYEFVGPDAQAAAYDAIRPDFALTGAPRLPMGLNLGAQIHWLLQTQPGLRARLARIVTYPQYWVGRLTGEWVCETTSLGCHTDLWEPRNGRFSALVAQLGLLDVMAPVRRANQCIGPVLPEICAATGLAPDTPVFCGIHDSNASLYPHVLDQTPPFSVLSTGTWVIAMAMGGAEVALDPARDTLINVNARGQPVPSARFMGGREYEILSGGTHVDPAPDDIAAVLAREILLLPSIVPESGPFQGRTARWSHPEGELTPGQRSAAVSLYLACMAATCLDMIGARGPTLTEGPFARNGLFLDMLAAITGRPVLLPGGSATGTSIGAALLALGDMPRGAGQGAATHPPPTGARGIDLQRYAALWTARAPDQKEPIP